MKNIIEKKIDKKLSEKNIKKIFNKGDKILNQNYFYILNFIKMKLIKPKFWINKTLISYIFYPLTMITYFSNIGKLLSKKKNLKFKLFVLGI